MVQDSHKAAQQCYDFGKSLGLSATHLAYLFWVLVFAMALSFGVGDHIEGGVLAAVIVLNVSIGFLQEIKAEKKMDSLRALSSPSAAALRDGKVDIIPRYVSPAIFSCLNTC